ncbi:MAG: CBS domain-containing protein [Clostridiales bacterium]|jgi:CBS domain-containing protein|nr:CBS domain-containing protein [Clostridiales bacterium]MBR2992244.1 CBS domain-containing protein [Clostridiales bacterium]MBR6986628.1 CBS domain-containing protein [Clostridiales bacterium]
MNIAFFTRPKQEITYLYNDCTVRQALEKMHNSSYTAVPVVDREGHYVGTVSEGDLLWFIVKGEGGEPHTMAIESLEDFKLTDVKLNKFKNQPISINSAIEDLIIRSMETNFVPIVDDRGIFIGIVTRRSIIKHYYEKNILPQE